MFSIIKKIKMKSVTIIFSAIPLLLLSCNRQIDTGINSGTAWGTGSFHTNGERIYFTATSVRETPITNTGGPSMGMMMMQGRMACISCHGIDAKGGTHMMHMEVMHAPDIRWSALSGDHHHEEGEEEAHEDHHEDYDFEDFRNAVEYGKHPNGDELSMDMPRWRMSDADLKDLMNYLKSL